MKIILTYPKHYRNPFVVTGPVDPYKVYISGLNDRITRDQLVLNLEDRMDCEVDNVVYGMDPKTVLVSFKQKIGTVYLKYFLTRADPGLWAGGIFAYVRTEIEDYISF